MEFSKVFNDTKVDKKGEKENNNKAEVASRKKQQQNGSCIANHINNYIEN